MAVDLFINLPVALVALMPVLRLVPESRMASGRQRVDAAGAVTAAGGLVAVVDGLLQAASHPWGTWPVLVPLAGGAGLLAVLVLGYSPLTGGLSYLPFGIALGAGMGLGTAVMPRVGVKPVLWAAFFGSAAGLLLTSAIGPGASYAGGILPGMIVLGASAGLSFPAILNAALHQVTGQDSSLASGVQTAVQQAGGALGLACLVTLAVRHAAGQIRHGLYAAVAITHGYALSLRIGAALLAAGGVLVLVLLERVTAQPRTLAAEPSPDPPVRTPWPRAWQRPGRPRRTTGAHGDLPACCDRPSRRRPAQVL